ncbi:MAG TPA: type II toxin-antitoxin system prevent-host-death family antitoxin [Blastocatellia bacterium]|nr:type II toxin-antitoxin system prevent-host-death family antitoxin [Blastocatellia bacterium]
MQSVNIAELKNNLSRYLKAVRRGEEVLIKDRDTPIAKIVPLAHADEEEAEAFALAAEGLLKLPEDNSPLPESFFTDPLPPVELDVTGLLREERDER